MSVSTYIAVLEMLIGKRTWHKTPHGHAEDDEDIDLVPTFPMPPGHGGMSPTGYTFAKDVA